MRPTPLIAVTAGEPAGIGPDLCLRLAERNWNARLVLLGDIELFRERARRLGAGVRLVPYVANRTAASGAIEVMHFPLSVPAVAGQPDPANARNVLAILEAAASGCMRGEFAAMVTAPVHKSIINAAGVSFPRHTEVLAQRPGAGEVGVELAAPTGPGGRR